MKQKLRICPNVNTRNVLSENASLMDRCYCTPGVLTGSCVSAGPVESEMGCVFRQRSDPPQLPDPGVRSRRKSASAMNETLVLHRQEQKEPRVALCTRHLVMVKKLVLFHMTV